MVCKGFILLAMLKTVLFVFSQYEYWIIFKYLCNSKVNALSVIGFYQLKELTTHNNYLNFSISLHWSHWGLVAFETSSRNLVSKTLSIYNYSLFLLTKGILLFCFAVVAIIACCMRSLHAVQDFDLLFFFFVLKALWHYLDDECASQKKHEDLCVGDEEVGVISWALTYDALSFLALCHCCQQNQQCKPHTSCSHDI